MEETIEYATRRITAGPVQQRVSAPADGAAL
jgi:hypothetical protein